MVVIQTLNEFSLNLDLGSCTGVQVTVFMYSSSNVCKRTHDTGETPTMSPPFEPKHDQKRNIVPINTPVLKSTYLKY